MGPFGKKRAVADVGASAGEGVLAGMVGGGDARMRAADEVLPDVEFDRV